MCVRGTTHSTALILLAMVGVLGAAQAVPLSDPGGQLDRHLLGQAGAVERGHRSTGDEDGSGSGSGDGDDSDVSGDDASSDASTTNSAPPGSTPPPATSSGAPGSTLRPTTTLPAVLTATTTTLSTTVTDDDVAQGSSNDAPFSSLSSSAGGSGSGAGTAVGVIFGLFVMLLLMSGLGYLTERQQALLDGKILFNATPTHEVVTIRNPAMEASDDAAKTMQEETAI